MSSHLQQNPLFLLAQVASELDRCPSPASRSSSPSSESFDSPSSTSSSSSMTSHVVLTERILSPTFKLINSSEAPTCTSPSNQLPLDPQFVPYVRPKKKITKAELDLKTRILMRARRKELLDKAKKIRSLENSPVNERQLSVLRMIYDEITMYPCESWMVLVAIIIHRAYKQVKNWFSNERQKNRYGESIAIETEEGDKVKLRPSALTMRAEWSDSFFEEVVMVYNYKIQRNSQSSNLSIRRSSRTSDQ